MIEIEGLRKSVTAQLVVDIERLSVAAGEIVALVGPVGSGRDGVLDLLLGKSAPTAGRVRVAGVDPVTDHALLVQRVGVLFAEDGLYGHRSARANLVFHCSLRGLPTSRADQVLEEMSLGEESGTRVERLDGALARRLALARALLHRPHVLLIVEPFVRCDIVSIAVMSDAMRRHAQNGGATLILSDDRTHLEMLCDAIHVLARGSIVESYSPKGQRSTDLPFKIPVRTEGSVILVNPGDILCVSAEEGRTVMLTRDGSLPTQYTMADLEARLGRSGFYRAHRSYLVNLQHVTEVIPFTRSSYSLRLDDEKGSLIPLSRDAARELRDLLGY